MTDRDTCPIVCSGPLANEAFLFQQANAYPMTDNFDPIGRDLWNKNPPEVDTTLDQYKMAVQIAAEGCP